MQPMTSSLENSSGGRLVDTTHRVLPLVSATIQAEASGGIARVVLRQQFRNTHKQPLAVTYSLPLPSDAAVGGFAFIIGDRRIAGEVDGRAAARERFEEALMEGRTAALLEQERSSLFTQELGNIPPNTDVQAEVTLDLRLRWLDDGAWELRIPTTTAPRYLGGQGRVEDAAQITQEIAAGPLATRLGLELHISELAGGNARPRSPSHTLDVQRNDSSWTVTLGPEGTALDRDVVVQWNVAAAQPGATVQTSRPATIGQDRAYGLLTIVPPPRSVRNKAVVRDLVVLLDTSGSMSGDPIEQAVRVTCALIDTLGPEDTLDLMAFSSSVQRWKRHAAPATVPNKESAVAWLRALRASGGTEMRDGILAALKTLRRDAQRQVVLVTDGLIGFEHEIVRAIAQQLPEGSRVHTVGVGSAVNRTLTSGAARAGRGVEVLVGIGEDAEPAARRLVSRTDEPLVTALSLEGSALLAHAPERLPDLFAGAPALIGLELNPAGGELTVRGHTASGAWEQRLRIPATAMGAGEASLARLVARERVEDLEATIAAGEPAHVCNARIEHLGVQFQIATRLTSWIAVDTVVSVDPSEPTRRERMPHELPHGMSIDGLGLRPAAAAGFGAQSMTQAGVLSSAELAAFAQPMRGGMLDRAARAIGSLIGGAAGAKEKKAERAPSPAAAPAPVQVKMRGEAPPAPSGAPPREQMKTRLGRKKASEVDYEESDLDAVIPRQESGSMSWVLRGRVVLLKGRQLTVEATFGIEAFTWDPGTEVRVRLADGTELTARVVGGTRAGSVSPGDTVRLTVELDRELGPSEAVRAVEIVSTSLVIEV